ncbi:MAG: hypothetical protein ACRD8W_24790, partial [Nitrososphaeraceae archaeon]
SYVWLTLKRLRFNVLNESIKVQISNQFLAAHFISETVNLRQVLPLTNVGSNFSRPHRGGTIHRIRLCVP